MICYLWPSDIPDLPVAEQRILEINAEGDVPLIEDECKGILSRLIDVRNREKVAEAVKGNNLTRWWFWRRGGGRKSVE